MSLAYFDVTNIPVSPVSNIPMSARACYLKPSRCGVSCELKCCVVETGSLNFTLQPLVCRMGVVWTVGGASRMRWLDCTDVEIFCVMSSCAKNYLMLVLSVYSNACLVLRRAWRRWIFWVYLLAVVVGGDVWVLFVGGFE